MTASRWLLRQDRALLLRVRKLHAPRATRVMRLLTRLGDAPAWFAYGLVLLVSGAVHPAVCLGAAAAMATAISFPLKRIFTRPRPDRRITGFQALTANPDAFSFPSGHAATAFAVATALSGGPPFLAALALLLALGIAASRVYLGAHYPLDVAAGLVLGIACGLAVRALFPF